MALVRILVDGYSLLHNWPELAPGTPRHSEAARDTLIRILGQYQDAVETPLTIIFDGAKAPAGVQPPVSTRDFEILYSGKGKTADDLIERAAYRLREYGDVLVVTDDFAERDTVEAFGALSCGCAGFIQETERALTGLGKEIARRNRLEKKNYIRKRNR